MSERAVSEVVSYILVFALIVSAVGIVSVSGLSTLQDVRNDEQINNAERAFDVLSDNLADIHRRNAPSRATEISLDQAKLSTGDNVTMTVTVSNSTGPARSDQWRLRPIVYSGSEDRQLVYEAGAIFRTSGSGSDGIRVQNPPFVVSRNRVLISIPGTNRPNRQAISGTTVLVRGQNDGRSVAFNGTALDIETVNVTLDGTPRAGLWEAYFEGRGFQCDVSGTDRVDCDYAPETTIQQVYVVYHNIDVEIES